MLRCASCEEEYPYAESWCRACGPDVPLLDDEESDWQAQARRWRDEHGPATGRGPALRLLALAALLVVLAFHAVERPILAFAIPPLAGTLLLTAVRVFPRRTWAEMTAVPDDDER